jgi:hypothetical protein
VSTAEEFWWGPGEGSELQYDIFDIQQKANEVYDKSPTPRTLKAIYGSMLKAFGAVEVMAGQVENDFFRDNPWMKTWVKDAVDFKKRMRNYRVTLDAFDESRYSDIVNYHGVSYEDVPRVYVELVQDPILKGNAASTRSPETLPYSVVHRADVSMPARLAQQLDQVPTINYNAGGMVARFAGQALEWIDESTEGVVDPWVDEKVEELVALAQEKVDEALPEIMDHVKEQVYSTAKKGATSGVIAPLLIGGLLILVAARKK